MTFSEDLFADHLGPLQSVEFEPTRRAGLARLEAFTSRAGAHYAQLRNYDCGTARRSTVSALSPWIRHRLISEEEILTQTLASHSPSVAMKFIQEVFWRSYFKGWLQQHPSVWKSYQDGLHKAQNRLETNVHQNTDYLNAIDGRTGISCFDHWCLELKKTGYLHNHARMWFASIWIFTLRLPWELGAHFFLNHLIDGDPASNALSWRWVGGLHTKGKTYQARSSNIAKYTQGAFYPASQLAETANPLIEVHEHPLVPFNAVQPPEHGNYLLLVTGEDCNPGPFVRGTLQGVLGLVLPRETDTGAIPYTFKKDAVTDAVTRLCAHGKVTTTHDWTSAILSAAQQVGTNDVRTTFAPIGPIATKLAGVQKDLKAAGITLHQEHRPYDLKAWPYATKGFFKLRKKIPSIMVDLGLLDAEN